MHICQNNQPRSTAANPELWDLAHTGTCDWSLLGGFCEHEWSSCDDATSDDDLLSADAREHETAIGLASLGHATQVAFGYSDDGHDPYAPEWITDAAW